MGGFQRRVLIVEDDGFFGSLLAGALTQEGFETQLAPSALAAKRQLKVFDPDVALVDIDLGHGSNGLDFIQMLSRTRPYISAIVLSKHPDAASAGLSGHQVPDGVAYLRKSLVHDTSALIEAINEAARGHAENLRHDRGAKGALDLLTRGQIDILHMMAMGLSNREIARKRGVSLSAVEQRVSEVFKALNIPQDDSLVRRVEAVRLYIAVCGVPER